MEEGFIFDHTSEGRGKTSEWFQGAAERSFWLGVKSTGKLRLKIRTYHCTACGFLESYAG